MAVKLLYLQSSLIDSWCALDEIDPGVAVSLGTGWVVGATVNTNRQSMWSGTKVNGGYTSATPPSPPLDTANHDCFRSVAAFNGTFAATNWTIFGVVRAANNASGQRGSAVYRLYKSPDATGATGVTQLTTAELMTSIATSITTSADALVNQAFTPTGPITFNNEYLFVQVAWLRTTVATMSTADVVLRYGTTTTGTRVQTPDFVAVPLGPVASLTLTLANTSSTADGSVTGVYLAPRTGTLALTLASTGVVAAGTVMAVRTATFAQTVAAATLSADVDVVASASSAATCAAATLSADTDVIATPSVSMTLADVTLSAAGTATQPVLARSATVAQTLANAASVAISTVAASAVLSATLSASAVSAAATVQPSATLVRTLAGATVTAPGTVATSATLATTLAATTVTAIATAPLPNASSAALVLTLTSTTVTAAGTVTPMRTAVLAQTLTSTALSASGAAAAGATLALTLAPVTSSGTGLVLAVRTATLTQTLEATVGAATGTVVGVLPITILPTTLHDPYSDVVYSELLTAKGGAGGPYTFSVVAGTLPPGLLLTAGGLILGTPTTGATLGPGSWPDGMIDVPYYQLLQITETGVGAAYAFTAQAQDTLGGTGTQMYTLTMRSGWGFSNFSGTFPSCLSVKVSPSTGVASVSGIPMTIGTWPLFVLATNTAGQTRTCTFTLTVRS